MLRKYFFRVETPLVLAQPDAEAQLQSNCTRPSIIESLMISMECLAPFLFICCTPPLLFLLVRCGKKFPTPVMDMDFIFKADCNE